MELAVDRVLKERRRLGRRSQRLGVIVSTLLHAAMLAAMIFVPMLESEAKAPPRFVSIAIVPQQALGVRDPEPARPAPTPQPPAPQPAVERPVETSKPKLPSPDPAPRRQPERAPAVSERPTVEPAERPGGDELRRRQGSPTGSATGTAAMGARVGFDNPNFRHSYFIDRMTAMLSSQWVRPAIGGELVALVHFRIHRDGTVTDIEIVESSGFSSYDLAAMRAVQQASPFPPLPRSFAESSLGVTVEFI